MTSIGHRLTWKSMSLSVAVLALLMMAAITPLKAEASNTAAFTGWSGSPTSNGAASAAVAPAIGPTPMWSGGAGCSGYFTGANPAEMQCKDTSVTVNNDHVAIRNGYWTGSGWGWSKAWYYHNLAMQPIIDAIRFATSPSGPYSDRVYLVYHYTNGTLDQEVKVIADIQNDSYSGVISPDYKPIGVLTGYCIGGNGIDETTCPNWVNSTL